MDQGGQATTPGTSGMGILPCQAISALWRDGEITAAQALQDGQIQPSSLDLRLGEVAYRVRASFLPGPGSDMASKIERFTMHAVDLTQGAVLERGCVYIVPLLERLALSERLSAIANPKSSTGRLDVFTRLITDGASEFDRVEAGYHCRNCAAHLLDPGAYGGTVEPAAPAPWRTAPVGCRIKPPASTFAPGLLRWRRRGNGKYRRRHCLDR